MADVSVTKARAAEAKGLAEVEVMVALAERGGDRGGGGTGEAAKEAAVNEASEMAAKAWAADATAAAVRRKPLRQKRLRARDGGEEEMAVRLCERGREARADSSHTDAGLRSRPEHRIMEMSD